MIKTTKVTYRIGEKGAVVSRPVISQGDVLTNRIEFSVFDLTLPYELESTGLGVTFYFVNRDGQYMALEASSIVDNMAYVDIPQEIINLVGQVDIEVEITDGSRVLNVTGFALSIEPSKRMTPGTFPLPEITELSWTNILGKPSTYPPSGHTHSYTQILEAWKILRDNNRVIDVTKYGATGNGTTDDSEALLDAVEAVKALGPYSALYFPPGVYIHGDGIVDPVNGTGNSWAPTPGNPTYPLIGTEAQVGIGRDIRLRFSNFDGLTIFGYGATIQSHPDNGECRNNIIFDFVNCNDLKVFGLTLDGKKQTRQPQFIDSFGSGRGNLQLQARRNVWFQDVTSRGSLMDGFYMAGINGAETLKGLRMINCTADDAYRNGLTISNCINPLVDGGRYINSGMTYGTLPMGGIDVEADWEVTINQGAIIRGAYFNNNEVMGLAISFRSHNTRVEHCIFDNEENALYFIDVEGAQSGAIVENNLFLNCDMGARLNSAKFINNRVVLKPTGASGESVENYFLYLYEQTHPGDYLEFRGNRFEVDLSDVADTVGYLNVGRFHFANRKNLIFEDNTVVNMMTYGGFSGYMFDYAENEVGDIAIRNNRFFLEDTRWVNNLGFALIKPVSPGANLNRVSGNQFIGYPQALAMPLSDNRFNSVTTGQAHKQTKTLGFETVHKINPFAIASQRTAVVTHSKISFHYYAQRVDLEVVIDDVTPYYRMKAFNQGAPTNTVPTWLNVWVKDGELYVKGMGYFVVAEYESVTTGGNGDGTNAISSGASVFSDVSEGSQTGGTLVGFVAHAPSCFALADLTSLVKPTGYSVYVTSLGKPAFWTGSIWVDAVGTTL